MVESGERLGPDKKRRTQAERRAETRRRVLAAAIQCLCEVGYSQTTTVLVAARARVSRGALQHQFPTRADLLIAVTEHIQEELRTAFDPLRKSSTSIEDRVAKVCAVYWDFYRSDTYLAQVQIWIGARTDPSLSDKVESAMQRVTRAQDRFWRETFADVGVPADRLIALRRLTIATLRGFALRLVYRRDAVVQTQEIFLLRELITRALGG